MEKITEQLVLAMDYDAQEKWDEAHEVVKDIQHEMAFRIHAYLHRKEGDLANANYWYQRVGEDAFCGSLEDEKNNILQHLKDN